MGLFSHAHKFDLVGYSHECKYKKNGFVHRQQALSQISEKEPVHLKKYTYKGSTAFAVISDSLKCDIGVIRASDVSKIFKYFGESVPQGYVSMICRAPSEYDEDEETEFLMCQIILE